MAPALKQYPLVGQENRLENRAHSGNHLQELNFITFFLYTHTPKSNGQVFSIFNDQKNANRHDKSVNPNTSYQKGYNKAFERGWAQKGTLLHGQCRHKATAAALQNATQVPSTMRQCCHELWRSRSGEYTWRKPSFEKTHAFKWYLLQYPKQHSH